MHFAPARQQCRRLCRCFLLIPFEDFLELINAALAAAGAKCARGIAGWLWMTALSGTFPPRRSTAGPDTASDCTGSRAYSGGIVIWECICRAGTWREEGVGSGASIAPRCATGASIVCSRVVGAPRSGRIFVNSACLPAVAEKIYAAAGLRTTRGA